MGLLGTSATEWPIVPAPGDYDDGEFGGMKIGRGNRSTRRKPAPAPLCPPQIPLDQTRARTRAAAVVNTLTFGTIFYISMNYYLQCILYAVFLNDLFAPIISLPRTCEGWRLWCSSYCVIYSHSVVMTSHECYELVPIDVWFTYVIDLCTCQYTVR
jgi:hypothetical protein